jgi:hypothetical protein
MSLEKKHMKLSVMIEETNETFQFYYQKKIINVLSEEEKTIIYELIDWFQEEDPQPEIVFSHDTVGRKLFERREDFTESKTGKWTKITIPNFSQLKRQFKKDIRVWLENYTREHIDLEYTNASMHKYIRYYYCGVKSTIDFHWSQNQVIIVDQYHQKTYVRGIEESLDELLHTIFNKIEQNMRIKNVLKPQRHHFDGYTRKLFRRKDREELYNLLLSVMTPHEIERLSAENKKLKKEINMIDDWENSKILFELFGHEIIKNRENNTWEIN